MSDEPKEKPRLQGKWFAWVRALSDVYGVTVDTNGVSMYPDSQVIFKVRLNDDVVMDGELLKACKETWPCPVQSPRPVRKSEETTS